MPFPTLTQKKSPDFSRLLSGHPINRAEGLFPPSIILIMIYSKGDRKGLRIIPPSMSVHGVAWIHMEQYAALPQVWGGS